MELDLRWPVGPSGFRQNNLGGWQRLLGHEGACALRVDSVVPAIAPGIICCYSCQFLSWPADTPCELENTYGCLQMVGSACLASVAALLLVCAHSQQMPDEAPDDPEFQIGFDPSALMTANVSYTDGTAALKGYLAYDNTTTGPRPGIIILPDWDGASPCRRSFGYCTSLETSHRTLVQALDPMRSGGRTCLPLWVTQVGSHPAVQQDLSQP